MTRRLTWRQALADLKDDRMTRPEIREEGLRGRCPAHARMSCWRGRSGRRYVVMVHDLADALTRRGEGAHVLAIAVSRDAEHRASIVAMSSLGLDRGRHALPFALHAGATEVHLYRLADTAEELAAVRDDLTAEPA